MSAVNETLRDNVFNGTVAGGGTGAQIAERGIEPVPQGVEFYNNTCYGSGSCAAFSGTNFTAAGINSFARNNLFYNSGTIANQRRRQHHLQQYRDHQQQPRVHERQRLHAVSSPTSSPPPTTPAA